MEEIKIEPKENPSELEKLADENARRGEGVKYGKPIYPPSPLTKRERPYFA